MNEKVFIKVMSITIAMVGLWILLKSTLWGIDSANDYLRSVGGGMETSQFGSIQESFMASYRLLGSVLLGAGLFGFFQKRSE